MVRGLLGVITSSPLSSLRKSQVSEEELAVSASGTPGPGSCGGRQRSTPFLAPGSSAGAGTMGTLASTLPGDSDPAAPPTRTTELPESVSSEPAPAAPLSRASALVGLGDATLTFSEGSAVKSLCGGGTTRNSLGFLEMGGGFLLGDGPSSGVAPAPDSASPAGLWLRRPCSAALSW